MSLRARILLLILAASLLPMAATLWVLAVIRADTIDSANEQLASGLVSVARNLDDRINGTGQLLFGLSRVASLGSANKAACSDFLANVLKEHSQYTGLLTILPNGQLHCDSLKTGRALDLNDRAYFQKSLKSTRYVVEPVMGRLTGKAVLQIAYPVRDGRGDLLYVLLASFNLDDFGSAVASTLPYEHMNFQIWSEDSRLVMDYPASGAKKVVPGVHEKNFVLSAATKKITTIGTGKDARIWSKADLSPATGTGLRLVYSVPKQDVVGREDAQLKRLLFGLVLLTCVLFLVALLLGEFGLRRQAGRLMVAISRLDHGNFKQLIGAPYPKGELGEMMLAVDRMAVSLEHQRDVIEHNSQELERQANTDTLTGLANRNLLNDRVEQAIIYAHRSQRVMGIILLDLDRFKSVNDSLGHNQGDVLLNVVAQRLRRCVREGDTVARLGGDEFVIVLADMAHDADLLLVAQLVLRTLAEPVPLEGQLFCGSTSLGISVYPRDGNTANELLRHADTAMYRAKEQGGNTMAFFTPEMDQNMTERLRIEAGLRRALDNNELRLHFQPIVNVLTGRIVSAEALLRWHDPQRGLVPPIQFIGIAEETGLIIPMGSWVLQQACLEAKAWSDQGLGPIPVAVNLSARQFNAPLLEATIAEALASADCPASLLQLEITESMVIANAEQALETMHRINRMGVQLSIDDFGTGYSSLSYLKRFPVSKLKIDRSFVNDIHVDENDKAIVDAILTLSRKLGLLTVAEGVETSDQLEFLKLHGCDEYQGYYMAKPCVAEDFVRLVVANRANIVV